MHSVRKIGMLIIAVILVPVLFISVYEIGNLKNNEKVIQDIYRNQLNAILFSINQYSDDVISNFASRLENQLNKQDTGSDELLRMVSEKPAIKCLLVYDKSFRFKFAVPECDSAATHYAEKLSGIGSNIKRLETYYRGNYRKIEPVNDTAGNQLIVFLLGNINDPLIAVVVLDPEKFISEVLDPKIQEIARNQFHIAAYRAGEPDAFYNSDKQYTPGAHIEKKPFWLLQNYQMGIELKNVTIADLAGKRARRSLILIGLMDIILLAGAFIIFRNIRKQIELSQLKNDFVANVSHEIRTPLALISMYIETLEMGRVKSPEKIKEYYSVIMNETSRLSAMVNRILNFSQIENKKRKYTFAQTNLNDAAESVFTTFRYTLENKGFRFMLETDPDVPLLNADRDAVCDALVNLVDNAMKYSAETKEITIRTGQTGQQAFVEVQDKGVGILQKHQKYIFDKFYRVTEKNLANRIKGSGLGLAIVKHIMEAHEGQITVQSEPGAGSTFRLLFPLK
ncbi:MAG TPA: ATP-binding protein [Bacteroidales bacterium]|nr:ATP-binding protein [Bacteroidales bacterium]